MSTSDEVRHLNENDVIDDFEIKATMIMLGVIFVVGSLGNGLVIYVYAQKNDKQTSTLFILVLAIVDFLSCVLIIPFTMLNEHARWMMTSDFLCKFYFLLNTSNTCFSSLLISAIAFDRYLCICHPFLRAMTVFRAKAIVAGLALFSIMLGSFTANFARLFLIKNDHDIAFNTSKSQNQTTESFFNDDSMYECSDYQTHGWTNESSHATRTFFEIIHKTNHGCFILCILVVVILYVLIYRTILSVRRKKKLLKGIKLRPPTGICSNQKLEAGKLIVSENTDAAGIKIQPDNNAMDSYNALLPHNNNNNNNQNNFNQQNKALKAPLLHVPHDCSQFSSDGKKISMISLNTDLPTQENGCTTNSSCSLANTPAHCDTQKVVIKQNNRLKKGASGLKFCRDTEAFQNMKTALMLFVVAVVFIITFLPAMLMANGMIKLNLMAFYLYYLNNTANPIIYCFMNQNFREDVRRILPCKASSTAQHFRARQTQA